MKIQLIVRGTSPLLCHNPQMVDPNFDLNREIKKITKKRTKTDEDLAEIERLEWFGGIYLDPQSGLPCQPTSKLRKCLINAGRITKQGKQVERAVVMTQLNVPLIYEGSDKATSAEAEIKRLASDRKFYSRLSVVIGGKRIMRVRPQFFPWAMVLEADYIADAGLNYDDLVSITDLAGRAERIGDNRVNGYGAFVALVRENTGQQIDLTLSAIDALVKEKL